MKTCIKGIKDWLDTKLSLKPWLWFIILWCGGLLSAFVFTYPFKLLIKGLTR